MEQLMSQLIQLAAMAPHMPDSFFDKYLKEQDDCPIKVKPEKEFKQYCLAHPAFTKEEKQLIEAVGAIEQDLLSVVTFRLPGRKSKKESYERLRFLRDKIENAHNDFTMDWIKESEIMEMSRMQAEQQWRAEYAEKMWRDLYKVAEKMWEDK